MRFLPLPSPPPAFTVYGDFLPCRRRGRDSRDRMTDCCDARRKNAAAEMDGHADMMDANACLGRGNGALHSAERTNCARFVNDIATYTFLMLSFGLRHAMQLAGGS